MTDFNNMTEDMTKALEQGHMPPKELHAELNKQFDKFPLKLQTLLVDNGIVGRQKCEVWSRVMGYFRPVGEWNVGKKQEHHDRIHLKPKDFKKLT